MVRLTAATPLELSEVDPAQCPICGRPNGCRRAARPDMAESEPCWCWDYRIPETLLARVPERARNKACICRACIERHGGWREERPSAGSAVSAKID